jgi:hypothetical protein
VLELIRDFLAFARAFVVGIEIVLTQLLESLRELVQGGVSPSIVRVVRSPG